MDTRQLEWNFTLVCSVGKMLATPFVARFIA